MLAAVDRGAAYLQQSLAPCTDRLAAGSQGFGNVAGRFSFDGAYERPAENRNPIPGDNAQGTLLRRVADGDDADRSGVLTFELSADLAAGQPKPSFPFNFVVGDK